MATMTYYGSTEREFVRDFVKDLKQAVGAIMYENWKEDDLQNPAIVDHSEQRIILHRSDDTSLILRQYNYGDRHITCYFEQEVEIPLNNIQYAVLNFDADPEDLEALGRFRTTLNLALGRKLYVGSFSIQKREKKESLIHKIWRMFKHVFGE